VVTLRSVGPAAVTIRVLTGEPGSMRELQRVIEGSPGYYERTMGAPPGPAEAQSIYSVLPEGKDYADKFVFGVYVSDAMVGCADLIRGYPDSASATLGLLLICEAHQGKGIGRRALEQIEQFARQWGSCDRFRIGVVRSNDLVMTFWVRQGFSPTGESRRWRQGSVESDIVYLEKRFPGTRND
jgi:GNAT superfamily N-acetyltransferase